MQWDAIVIGSGIGGLTAAVALARLGKRVLVLEQHFVLGGHDADLRTTGFALCHRLALHRWRWPATWAGWQFWPDAQLAG